MALMLVRATWPDVPSGLSATGLIEHFFQFQSLAASCPHPGCSIHHPRKGKPVARPGRKAKGRLERF